MNFSSNMNVKYLDCLKILWMKIRDFWYFQGIFPTDFQLYEMYTENRLPYIRENWVTLTKSFTLVILLVMTVFSFDTSEVHYFRLFACSTILAFLHLTRFLVMRFDFAAKYSGVLFSTFITFIMVEVNCKLDKYR